MLFNKKIKSCHFFVIFLSIFFIQNISLAATFSPLGVRLNKKVRPMREIKRDNVVTQSLDYSCGAAGLSTLLRYYLNDPIEEVEIINSLLNDVPLEKIKERKGFSLFDLKNYAKSKGYKVTGYKMDINFLKKLDKPVLVPIQFRNYRHFVIVRAVVGDRVFLADPAAGNVSMKKFKFEKIWTDGIGLVVEKMDSSLEEQYALKTSEKDLVFADYKNMRRIVSPDVIRTAIYPGEF